MSNILKTKVADTGLTQLIQRLGRDCTPTQFLREFTMNSSEAIQRTGEPGKILVDVNWDIWEKNQTYKLCFTDTGDGMTGQEMMDHLNNLSSSGHSNNVYENYGVGAKIAALTRNHVGIMYDSWKNGKGNNILIRYDSDSKAYGIEPVIDEQGTSHWFVPLDDAAKPQIIGDHGTRVTLFGMTDEQDTLMPPANARGGRENWLYQYLNTRFFDLPAEIDLQVRIGYWRDRENKKHNYTRRVEGQRASLAKHTINSGVVDISDAKVHWWILDRDRDGHGREYLLGHTGCLNQNELFDLADGRSSKATGFGILFGKEDVIIYVEPAYGYVQNTARTGLIQVDGSVLPWDRWQDEFRASMPPQLLEFVRQRASSASNVSHEDTIRARLKSISQFFKISRYRASLGGVHLANPNSEVVSTTGGGSGGNGGGNGGRRTREGSAAGSFRTTLLSKLTTESGVASVEENPSKFPSVVWVCIADGNRYKDDIEDRAAEFIEQDNLIKANADFQGITDIISYFVEQYPDVEQAESIIKNEVQEAFEQQLIETVAGAMSLKNRPKWNPDEYARAISQEALTAAVMPRYHLVNYIKRQIGNKLGKSVNPQAA